MPITKRQFELRITPEVEEWMGKVYGFLENHRSQAYSVSELVEQFSSATHKNQDVTTLIKVSVVTLVGVGALGCALVRGESYYAFQQYVEKGTWRTLAPF